MFKKIFEKFNSGKFPNFVHPEKQSWIEAGDPQLEEIFPTLSDDAQLYLEMISVEEYQRILSNIEKYTGVAISASDLPKIVGLFFQTLTTIRVIEKKNKDVLEKLALEVVLSLPEFKMVREAYADGDVQFAVQLGTAQLDLPSIEVPEEGLSDAEELNVELAKEFEELDAENDLKRRLANLFIQGTAVSKMESFHLVSDKLNAIHPKLVNMYGLVSAAVQLGYWVAAPGVEPGAVQSKEVGGSAKVEPKGEDYIIDVQGIVFPFLVHELVKGIYEWISIDPDLKSAMQRVDSIEGETKDLMFGPGIATRFQKMIPTNKQEYIPLIYKKFLKLAKEDVKEVLAQSSQGKKILSELIEEAEDEWLEFQEEIKRAEYEDNIDRGDDWKDVGESVRGSEGDLALFKKMRSKKVKEDYEERPTIVEPETPTRVPVKEPKRKRKSPLAPEPGVTPEPKGSIRVRNECLEIFESNKSLKVYKKLITVLGDYSTNFPATGVSKLFNQAVANGKKILPTDKLALNILWTILSKESSGAVIHKLLNIRFSNLPTELQPLVQDGRSKEVAFWVRGAAVGDKVKDLIDFADVRKKGTWGDVDGGKVKLIDITIEEK